MQDGFLGVREVERRGGGGVEDEVARGGVAPPQTLAVRAVDDLAAHGDAQVRLEEEEARGVGGEDEREEAGRGGLREHVRGDGEDRDARGAASATERSAPTGSSPSAAALTRGCCPG